MTLKMVKQKDIKPPVVKNPPVEEGMYENMPAEEYFAVDALSTSLAKLISRSPAHARVGFKGSPRMDLGSGLHGMVLEPDRFDKDFMVLPLGGKRTAKIKEEAAEKGQTILTAPDMVKINGMNDAIWDHPHAAKLLSGGLPETSWFWKHQYYPCYCKCRTDYYKKDMKVLVDIKTIADARENSASKQIGNFKYHWQAALNLEGVTKITGKKHDLFAFVFVEVEPPHGVNTFFADEEMLNLARSQLSNVVNTYVECLKTGEWPCYPVNTLPIALQHWEIPFQMRKPQATSAVE